MRGIVGEARDELMRGLLQLIDRLIGGNRESRETREPNIWKFDTKQVMPIGCFTLPSISSHDYSYSHHLFRVHEESRMPIVRIGQREHQEHNRLPTHSFGNTQIQFTILLIIAAPYTVPTTVLLSYRTFRALSLVKSSISRSRSSSSGKMWSSSWNVIINQIIVNNLEKNFIKHLRHTN